jgi:hypothetical protein
VSNPFDTRADTRPGRGRFARAARRLGLALLGVLVLGAAVPAAGQAAPTVPGAQPVLLADAPAGEFCSFPVLVTALDGTRVHNLKGTVAVTGPFTVTVTNEATGVSRTFNASGPTLIDRSTGNLVLVGPSLIGQPASRNVGPAFLILNFGRTEFTSNNTIASITGQRIDICAALA